MEETLVLKAQPREALGKKVKLLRKKEQIPAVLYGHKVKSLPLIVNQEEFEKIFQKAGASTLINLKIDQERPKKVLIHELQRDPVTLKPLHVDLYQVKMTEKITTEIPLKLIGEAGAVKELDGTLIQNRDSIEVECLPDALVSEIEVDISNLKTFEDMIKVSNLKVPSNIRVLNDPEEVVVSITPPRTEEELAELEAPVEEKVEEVEKVEKKEEVPEEEAEEEKEKPEEPAPKATAGEPEKIPELLEEQQKPKS